jgi:hypothetical protein
VIGIVRLLTKGHGICLWFGYTKQYMCKMYLEAQRSDAFARYGYKVCFAYKNTARRYETWSLWKVLSPICHFQLTWYVYSNILMVGLLLASGLGVCYRTSDMGLKLLRERESLCMCVFVYMHARVCTYVVGGGLCQILQTLWFELLKFEEQCNSVSTVIQLWALINLRTPEEGDSMFSETLVQYSATWY